MTQFKPQDPDFERRVRESFARQRVMETMGATLLRVAAGEVEIALPFSDALPDLQQSGQIRAD